jgi:hypothetical protein
MLAVHDENSRISATFCPTERFIKEFNNLMDAHLVLLERRSTEMRYDTYSSQYDFFLTYLTFRPFVQPILSIGLPIRHKIGKPHF